jgi:hypothetical protein
MSSSFRLVLIPGIITLAVTLLRLVGELNGWSPTLFNPAAGGGGAIVGIAWLVPVFGIYFALKVRQSEATLGAGRTVGYAVVALAAFFAVAFGGGALLGLDPNTPSLASLVVTVVASLVALALAYAGSPALGKVLVAYGLAARLPVILVMFIAMLGSWGTHYDAPPPGFPEMGVLGKWFAIGVVPQLTIWMAFTVVLGALFGGIALALVARRRTELRTA